MSFSQFFLLSEEKRKLYRGLPKLYKNILTRGMTGRTQSLSLLPVLIQSTFSFTVLFIYHFCIMQLLLHASSDINLFTSFDYFV